MIDKLLGFKTPVVMFIKTGGGYKQIKDKGKHIKTKGGTIKFDLWKEKVSLPDPPAESMIGDTVYIYSVQRGSYDYVLFNPKDKKFEIIDADMTHWAEQEIKEGNNKYDDVGWLGKYAPYIMMGIFMFLCVLGLVIYFQQVIFPMIEAAKNIGSTHCVCDCGLEAVKGLNPPI